MIGLSGTAAASAPGGEKPPETANPQSRPVAEPPAGTSATADQPKADTPVAAQADLLTPLLTGTPATDAKLVEPKTEAPQPAATSASAASTVEAQRQPQASEPPPLNQMWRHRYLRPASSQQRLLPPINLEQPTEPAPKTPANKPKVDTAVTTQADAPALLPTSIQPSQPAQIPDPTAAKPPVPVDSNASTAAMPQTSEPGAAQPAAAPAPISLEQPADAGAKPPAVADPVLKDLDSMPLPPLGSDSEKPKSSRPQTVQDAPASTTDPVRHHPVRPR